MQSKRGTTGIVTRHSRSCSTRQGAKCSCKPSFQANAFNAREGRIYKTFRTLAAAKAWRADAQVGLRKGTMRAPTRITVREAAEAWLEGVKTGAIDARGGTPYKPSAIRSYEGALRHRVLPHFGGTRLSDVRHIDLQDFAERLRAEGLDPSTIRNTIMPLRTIYRRAVARGDVGLNPTSGLELPAVTGRRDRIASQAEASKLLAALPELDRAFWATAFYAGLRRGELLALRWEDVNLVSRRIRVERAWDERAGFIEPKSRAAKRTIPIVAPLRAHLISHKRLTDREYGLVFGTTANQPPTPSNIWRRAHAAWKAAKLNPIGLHECRHTFASLMIDANSNVKELTVYMGHASVTTTFDLYGKLMPGNEDDALKRMDAYFERADTGARVAQLADHDH